MDTSFNPGTGVISEVYSLAAQADGKILIGGSFTSYNGTARNRIARLNTDGSLDTGFNPGTGANDTVASLTLQADGKVFIGGSFTTYNGTLCRLLARLSSSPATQILAASSTSRIWWMRGGSAPEVEQVVFERSPDGVIWTNLGNGTRMSGGWELTGLTLPTSGQLRARGRASSRGSSSVQQTATYSSFITTPLVTVAAMTGITPNAASGGGEVTADGGATVEERGLVYATAPDPTLASGTKVTAGSGIGSFTANVSSLATNTTYYVRAYATNVVGTGYSSGVSFNTLPSGLVTIFRSVFSVISLGVLGGLLGYRFSCERGKIIQ